MKVTKFRIVQKGRFFVIEWFQGPWWWPWGFKRWRPYYRTLFTSASAAWLIAREEASGYGPYDIDCPFDILPWFRYFT